MNYTQLLENELALMGEDKVSFYIEPYESINKISENYDFENEKILSFSSIKGLKISLKKRGRNTWLREKVNYWIANKENLIFEGEGGIGKTLQLYMHYQRVRDKTKILIRAKNLNKFLEFHEFKSFVNNEENTLYIDGLNEGILKNIISFFSSTKCRIVATSRPLQKEIDNFKIIELKMHVTGIDISTKMSINNKLPSYVINILGYFDPRMSLKLLKYISENTKFQSVEKKNPIGILRDMFEQYFEHSLKEYGLNKKPYWNFIKKTNNFLRQLTSVTKLKKIKKISINLPNRDKFIEYIIGENIIQPSDKGWIISHKSLFSVLRAYEILGICTNSEGWISKSKLTTIQEECNIDFFNGVGPIVFAEILYRYLRKNKDVKLLIKDLLIIAYPIVNNYLIKKPPYSILQLNRKKWFSSPNGDNAINKWLIIVGLSIALSAHKIKFKFPIELVHDFVIESTDPIFISQYLPFSYKQNEFYLDEKTFIKSDKQLLNRLVAFKKIPKHSWFWYWVENNLFIFFNTFVSIGYDKGWLLKKIIMNIQTKNHYMWFNIATLYYYNKLRFSLAKYANIYKVPKNFASYHGFRNVKRKLSDDQFVKYIKNKKYYKNISKNYSTYIPSEIYDIAKYFKFNHILEKYSENNYKWESLFLKIYYLLKDYQLRRMIDKYFWEFEIEPSELLFNINLQEAIEVSSVNLKNIGVRFKPYFQRINKEILKYTDGQIYYEGCTVTFESITNVKTHTASITNNYTQNQNKNSTKYFFKNGYLIKSKIKKYMIVIRRDYQSTLFSKHLIDIENKKIYDYDQNFKIYTENIWINERDINCNFFLKEVINKKHPKKLD